MGSIIISKSYNDDDIVMQDIDILGSEKNIEVYSTGNITLGPGFSVGGGATLLASPGSCIY